MNELLYNNHPVTIMVSLFFSAVFLFLIFFLWLSVIQECQQNFSSLREAEAGVLPITFVILHSRDLKLFWVHDTYWRGQISTDSLQALHTTLQTLAPSHLSIHHTQYTGEFYAIYVIIFYLIYPFKVFVVTFHLVLEVRKMLKLSLTS